MKKKCHMCNDEAEARMMYILTGPDEIEFTHTDVRYLCEDDTIYFKRIMDLATQALNRFVDENPKYEGKTIKHMEFEVKLLKAKF